jgi:protoheme IX farnesyltransferase
MKTIGIFANLIKYRLSFAVTFSSVTGYFICSTTPDLSLLSLSAGIFLLSSGAAALNQYTERDYDSLMERTRGRPIPRESIDSRQALLISIILLIGGMTLLFFAGVITASLGLFTLILYNLIYTRMKRITPLAIIPGALVGAIPPLMGFTAAGGTEPGVGIIIFSVFMFLWQLPHFALIIVKYRNEYRAAGFRIASGNLNDSQLKKLVFAWVMVTTAVLLLFSEAGLVFNRYVNLALIPVNIIFILTFYGLLFKPGSQRDTRGAFILINSFSILVMLLFILNAFVS